MDRAQLVGLGFFAVLSGGLMFGLGYSAGKVPRADAPKGEPPVLAQIDQEHALREKMKHDKVDYTFFNELVKKEDAKALAPAPVAVPVKLAEAVKAPEPKVIEPKVEAPTLTTAMAPTAVIEEPAAKPAPVAPKAPKSGEFTIQVSAFKMENDADELMNKLTAKGFKPVISPLELQGKGTWYRVRVGHFATKAAADTTMQKLERENFPTWIVKAE